MSVLISSFSSISFFKSWFCFINILLSFSNFINLFFISLYFFIKFSFFILCSFIIFFNSFFSVSNSLFFWTKSFWFSLFNFKTSFSLINIFILDSYFSIKLSISSFLISKFCCSELISLILFSKKLLSSLLDMIIFSDNFGFKTNLLNCWTILISSFLVFVSIFIFSFFSDLILSDNDILFIILLNISEYFFIIWIKINILFFIFNINSLMLLFIFIFISSLSIVCFLLSRISFTLFSLFSLLNLFVSIDAIICLFEFNKLLNSIGCSYLSKITS